MTSMVRKTLILLFLTLFLPLSAQAKTLAVAPKGHVNDFGNALTGAQEARVENRLSHYRRISGHDLVIITFEEKPENDYVGGLMTLLESGRPSLRSGVVMFVGSRGWASFISGADLPPTVSRQVRIVEKDFRGNADDADLDGRDVMKALDEVIAVLSPRSTTAVIDVPAPLGRILAVIFFASMLVLPWLAAVSARSLPTPGGAYAGLVAAVFMIFTAGPEMGLLVLVLLCPVGYLLDRTITRHYEASRAENRAPAWWAGGRWL